MTVAENLRIWNALPNQIYTEARVFSCVISAFEDDNREIDEARARAVLKVIWPKSTNLGAVPREIRGTSGNKNNNRNRQADFSRLMQLLHVESDPRPLSPPKRPSAVHSGAGLLTTAASPTEAAGVGSEPPVASDLDPPPADRVVTTVSRVVRNTELATRIKRLHHQLCQLCGETVRLADGTGYAEGHHIQPLGRPHDGPDVAESIACLCPNHHAACDLGAMRLAGSDFRSAGGHVVGQRFIDYHNRVLYRGERRTEPDGGE